MDKIYDYAIAGTGVAGLSLAYFLHQEGLLHNKTLLMIDQRRPEVNDKTWSFWHQEPIPFSDLAYARYNNFTFQGPGFHTQKTMMPYQYSMIRAIDFYNFMLNILEKLPNITWHFDKIMGITAGEPVKIKTENQIVFAAHLCFNSAFPNYLPANPRRYIHLKQHFLGWVVNFQQPVFETDTFTIHDFDIPQQDKMQFVYILPYNEREALVEFTIFSEELVPEEYYENNLYEYLEQKIGLKYEILHREYGVIPMTDDPFAVAEAANLINIGTLAGAVKPSTGYGFKRITHHTRRIASALKKGLPVHNISACSPWHFQWLDSIMLEVLKSHGDKGARIFTALFRHRSPLTIFRFLDEKANLLQIISVMLAMPYKHLFFISMLRVLSRKVFLRKFR